MNVSLVIPKSTFDQFRKSNPNLRWGQEFYTFMQLHKVKSERVFFDRLYNEQSDEVAKKMVLSIVDHTQ